MGRFRKPERVKKYQGLTSSHGGVGCLATACLGRGISGLLLIFENSRCLFSMKVRV